MPTPRSRRVKTASFRLTRAAAADLARIIAHSRRRFGVQAASELRRRIFDRLHAVAALPLSGRVPPELAGISDEHLREVVLAPHRIFYFVQRRGPIVVFAIADGRRDLDQLLIQRAVALPGLS